MSEEGNIDDIFKQKLGNHSVKPSENVWANIDSTLDNNGKKGFLFFRWAMLALLISGTLIGAILVFNNYNSAENSTILSATNTELNNQKVQGSESISAAEGTDTPQQTETVSKPTTENKDIVFSKQTAYKNENKREPNSGTEENASNSSSAQNTSKTPAVVQPKAMTPFAVSASTLGAVGIAQTESPTNPESRPESIGQGFSSGMEIENTPLQIGLNFMTAKNIGFEKFNPELIDTQFDLSNISIKHAPWSIGAYYEANWNFKRIDTKVGESASLDSIISSESTTFSSGFGMNIAYTTKNGIRISTGIEFAKWCRSASYPVSIPLIIATGPGSDPGTYNGEILGSTGDQNISVDNADLPAYESVALSPENLEFEIDIHECYSAIGIPLRIGYELNMGDWNLVPEVGFTYNRIIDSEIEGDASFKLNSLKLNRENNYSKDIFSFSGSVSLERKLNESFKLGLVGSYRYWITPIYTNAAFETHPYIFSGRLGIWYTIK